MFLKSLEKPGHALARPGWWVVWFLIGVAGGCSSPGCEGKQGPARRPAESADDEATVRSRLEAALVAKGPGYVPRTRHLNPDGSPRYTNRLIVESSPYLLQHAHNPVDWFPWGDEAFERARRLGRPVFLSVGYSTCHWCHVMEEESFEDEDVARYLNEHYVCIKVDREERPDVDATHMTFVQALTGNGGWPMSVWLTPTREPFFGGTYFPPASRGSRQGFLDVLRAQVERFTQDGAAVTAQAATFVERLRARTAPEPAGDFPSATLLDAATAAAARRFDPVNGGNRGAPKFPSSFPVQLLLRVARRTGDAEPRRMALTTLERMRAGGLYDQIGGGFHRYSVDARWLVPHFEKMLYDNALLATTYLEATQLTGDARFAATTREVLDYLLRELRAPDGTFYSATDADSPTPNGRREEGYSFTWTPAEVDAALGADDARFARAWLGVSALGEVDGRSVLRVEREPIAVASDLHLDVATAQERAASIRGRLFEARARRPPPLRDDKVIVAWNAITVSALACAAIVLGEPRYAEAATRASAALIAELEAHRPLPHLLSAGRPQGRAFADDAASRVRGASAGRMGPKDPRGFRGRAATRATRVIRATPGWPGRVVRRDPRGPRVCLGRVVTRATRATPDRRARRAPRERLALKAAPAQPVRRATTATRGARVLKVRKVRSVSPDLRARPARPVRRATTATLGVRDPKARSASPDLRARPAALDRKVRSA